MPRAGRHYNISNLFQMLFPNTTLSSEQNFETMLHHILINDPKYLSLLS